MTDYFASRNAQLVADYLRDHIRFLNPDDRPICEAIDEFRRLVSAAAEQPPWDSRKTVGTIASVAKVNPRR